MKNYGRVSKDKPKQNPITDTSKINIGIRKSVVAVLSKTDNFNHLVSDSNLVNKISDAVFASIYKKYGNYYLAKNNSAFDNMVESILFNTQKVCQVEEAKNQITKASEIIATEDIETIKLDVIMASVSEKLNTESSKDLDFFESNFKNEVNDVVYAGSGMDLKTLPARKDLLYLDLILVAEGTNANRDTVPAEELENRYLTLIGMPLVESHIEDAIHGVFYDSKLVRIKPGATPGSIKIVENGGRLAVRAKAYVYKNRFPRQAYLLKEREERGLLRYSVELGFSESECSFCHKKFKKNEPYCEHLLMRNMAKDLNFSRIVRDIYFIGGAYTINPAEKSAISLGLIDPEDDTDEKVNKSKNSCVNTIEDTGKVNQEAFASKNKNKHNDGDTKSPESDGGHRMEFKFNSVEELLAAPEVSSVIEASTNNIIKEEREEHENAMEEADTLLKAAKEKQDELEETLAEKTKQLEEMQTTLASMEKDKRVSDAILDLQKAGYTFDSDEEIKTFADKISDMPEDSAQYVVDMMKKSIVSAETAEEDPAQEEEEPEEAPAEEENEQETADDTLEASRRAGRVTPPSGEKDLLLIRKKWDERKKSLYE